MSNFSSSRSNRKREFDKIVFYKHDEDEDEGNHPTSWTKSPPQALSTAAAAAVEDKPPPPPLLELDLIKGESSYWNRSRSNYNSSGSSTAGTEAMILYTILRDTPSWSLKDPLGNQAIADHEKLRSQYGMDDPSSSSSISGTVTGHLTYSKDSLMITHPPHLLIQEGFRNCQRQDRQKGTLNVPKNYVESLEWTCQNLKVFADAAHGSSFFGGKGTPGGIPTKGQLKQGQGSQSETTSKKPRIPESQKKVPIKDLRRRMAKAAIESFTKKQNHGSGYCSTFGRSQKVLPGPEQIKHDLSKMIKDCISDTAQDERKLSKGDYKSDVDKWAKWPPVANLISRLASIKDENYPGENKNFILGLLNKWNWRGERIVQGLRVSNFFENLFKQALQVTKPRDAPLATIDGLAVIGWGFFHYRSFLDANPGVIKISQDFGSGFIPGENPCTIAIVTLDGFTLLVPKPSQFGHKLHANQYYWDDSTSPKDSFLIKKELLCTFLKDLKEYQEFFQRERKEEQLRLRVRRLETIDETSNGSKDILEPDVPDGLVQKVAGALEKAFFQSSVSSINTCCPNCNMLEQDDEPQVPAAGLAVQKERPNTGETLNNLSPEIIRGPTSIDIPKNPLVENMIEFTRYEKELQAANDLLKTEGLVHKIRPTPTPTLSQTDEKGANAFDAEVHTAILDSEGVKTVLSNRLCMILAQEGFTHGSLSAIEILSDVLSQFYTTISSRLKDITEKEMFGVDHGFPDALERVLVEMRLGGVRGLDAYYKSQVSKSKKLMKSCWKARQELASGISKRLPAPLPSSSQKTKVSVPTLATPMPAATIPSTIQRTIKIDIPDFPEYSTELTTTISSTESEALLRETFKNHNRAPVEDIAGPHLQL